jgi:hypothetical protein
MLTSKIIALLIKSGRACESHQFGVGFLDPTGRPVRPNLLSDLSRSCSKRKGTVVRISWQTKDGNIVAKCTSAKKAKKIKGKKKTSPKPKQKR